MDGARHKNRHSTKTNPARLLIRDNTRRSLRAHTAHYSVFERLTVRPIHRKNGLQQTGKGRGLTVFTWGLVIGLVTYLALGTGYYVRFGILHLIGLSIILAYPFLRYRWLTLALGIVLIALGPLIQGMRLDLPWLEWLVPTPGSGLGYAPLLPLVGGGVGARVGRVCLTTIRSELES